MNYKKIFNNIYQNGLWNDNQVDVPLSGPGSSIENACEAANMLDIFVITNKISSIIDLGCGDLTWARETKYFNNQDIFYCGVDIVSSVIKSHTESFPSNKFPNKKFLNYDITKLIIDEFDLVILRDVIFHLYNNDIKKIFRNIENKFKYLAITSSKNKVNTDTFNKWHFAEKNIHKIPFCINENFLKSVYESNFNRNLYIYDHNSFYRSDNVRADKNNKPAFGKITQYIKKIL